MMDEIERIKEILYENIEKIAKMRASNMDMGSSSIAGLVIARIFPDYKINIEYGQSGSTDGYSDRLWFEFSRENVFNYLEDIKENDDGSFYDELNHTNLSWDEVINIALDEGLFDDTKNLIDEQINELEPIKCPHCGSTNIRKHGLEIHADGEHQRYQCKYCHHHFISDWVL